MHWKRICRYRSQTLDRHCRPSLSVSLSLSLWQSVGPFSLAPPPWRFVKHNTRQRVAKGFPPFAILAVRSTEILFIHALRYRYLIQIQIHLHLQPSRDMPITHATNNELNSVGGRGSRGRGRGKCMKSKWKIYSHIAHISMPLER